MLVYQRVLDVKLNLGTFEEQSGKSVRMEVVTVIGGFFCVTLGMLLCQDRTKDQEKWTAPRVKLPNIPTEIGLIIWFHTINYIYTHYRPPIICHDHHIILVYLGYSRTSSITHGHPLCIIFNPWVTMIMFTNYFTWIRLPPSYKLFYKPHYL